MSTTVPLNVITGAAASPSEGVTATTASTVCSGIGNGVTISAAVFAVLAFINACVQTSGWRRRQGFPYVECTTILYFFLSFCDNLANVILVVVLGYSTYLFAANGNAGDGETINILCATFVISVGIAFLFKLVHVLYVIYEQSSCDIFLVDWEKPGNTGGGPDKVSIWRCIFVANEWNEIQTSRKISTHFQMFIVLFVLSILNANLPAFANSGEDGALNRFTIGGLTYVIAALTQILYCTLFHERVIKDQMGDFMDLCSVCNVSVFVLSHNNFGYYIHGRSVHGKADVDMSELSYMLRREEEGSVPRRGLLSGSDSQVFEIMIPHLMRQKIDSIYRPLQQNTIQAQKEKQRDSMKVHNIMKTFLQAFFDHALLDLDYIVTEKLFFEKVFGINFQEAINKAYLTIADDYAFTNVLYYGNETVLLSFDILLFFLLNITTDNYVIATAVTYLIGEVLAKLRSEVGCHNLAKKTLIEKIFLI